MISRNDKVHYSTGSRFVFLLFFLTVTRSGRLAKIRWSVCMPKSQRSWWVSLSRMDSGLCIYHLFLWSKLSILHNSQWITFHIQSCIVLCSFFALTYCICLLCEWSFHLYQHITYIYYYVASCIFCFNIFSSYCVVLYCHQKRFWPFLKVTVS